MTFHLPALRSDDETAPAGNGDLSDGDEATWCIIRLNRPSERLSKLGSTSSAGFPFLGPISVNPLANIRWTVAELGATRFAPG